MTIDLRACAVASIRTILDADILLGVIIDGSEVVAVVEIAFVVFSVIVLLLDPGAVDDPFGGVGLSGDNGYGDSQGEESESFERHDD